MTFYRRRVICCRLTMRRCRPFVSNEVVVSDNAIEWQLNEAATHERVTETVQNALAMSDCPLFQAAGFEGNVYAGVIANSPRPAEALRYLQYLSSDVRP